MKLPPAILLLLSGLLVSATVPGCSEVSVPRTLASSCSSKWVAQPSWSLVHYGGASDGGINQHATSYCITLINYYLEFDSHLFCILPVLSRFIKKVLNFFGFSRSEVKQGEKSCLFLALPM